MKKIASKTASKGLTNSKSNAAKDTVSAPTEKHVTTSIAEHHAPVEVHKPVVQDEFIHGKISKLSTTPDDPAVEKALEVRTTDSLYNEIKAAIKGASAEKKVFLEEQIGADLSLRLQSEGYFTTNPSAATGFKTMVSWR